MKLAGRLRGTLVVLRDLPGQRRIPFLPAEQTIALQNARVQEMVHHAVETVPYYRELFAKEGIDPREIRTAEQLRQLPLIDKMVVLEQPERFRSTSPDTQDSVPFTTSGSSWTPLTVYHDRRSLLAGIAHSERYRMVERAFVGKKVRWKVAMIAHQGTGRSIDAHHRTTVARMGLSKRRWIPVHEPVERVLERIAELRPDVLAGYGSYLEYLFRLVAQKGLRLQPPRVVRYGGDTMSADGRALIESHFGLPVLSNYNAVEVFKVGYFCELRRGYHLHEDLCDVWLAGANDEPVAPGERGEVVISNLVNRATVLLNYRLGDLARLAGEPCPCRRTSRLLSAVDGRVSEIIRLPSGHIVHPFAFLPVILRYQEITRSQLVQREPTRFELKVATVEPAAYERISQPLARELSDVLGGSTVDVTLDGDLGRAPGKHAPVVPLRS